MCVCVIRYIDRPGRFPCSRVLYYLSVLCLYDRTKHGIESASAHLIRAKDGHGHGLATSHAPIILALRGHVLLLQASPTAAQMCVDDVVAVASSAK